MENKQLILQFYTTGRYECDYDFYVYLLKLVKQLNLYEWQAGLESQAQHVKKIKELTVLNSKHSDEDYEDDELISQTLKIKSMISNICTKDIHAIIKECEDLNWEPYASKIYRRVSGKADYEKILERIQSTIHSEQFRIDSMLFTTIFEFVNGQALNQFVEVYLAAIQIFLKYLTGCKLEIDTINDSSKYSNLCNLQKVKKFVATNYCILRSCLRFCEIIKVLVGKNNLSLKFTVIKKQLQKLIKQHPEWHICDEKDDIFAILPAFKSFLKGKSEFDKSCICRWCFKLLKKEKDEHAFCRHIISQRKTFAKE